MTPAPEDVLKLAASIVETKRALAQLEASWNALFPSSTSAMVDAATDSSKTRAGSGLSRILAFLQGAPEKAFEPLFISQTLNIPLATTRTSLSKLVKKGLLEKRGAGIYGAKRAGLGD